MKHNFEYINSELSQIKQENLYRKLRYGYVHDSKITFNNKDLINLCSNDYLGIRSKVDLNKIQMQSSSRLVSGNDIEFLEVERKLAKHKSKEASLVYPTGYMANIGAISSIIKKGDLILSDELNHASIIESCKLAGAKTLVYKHNDMNDLKTKLNNEAKNKFIITEGIFSMDGDFSELKQITEIAKKNNAITILDDAHGDFVVGKDGKGTADHFHVLNKIDVYISSLSKGLGSFGGYIASYNNVIDYCINKSKSFIYTSALPSILIHYSLMQFESNREKNRKKLENNRKVISKGLKQLGYNITSKTHIIPILIGNEKITMNFSEFLYNNGVYVQAIRYPTVSKNHARLRLSVTASLSKKNIEDALDVFELASKKFKI